MPRPGSRALRPRATATERRAVYPELFRVGTVSVATYGVVVALAVLVGASVLARGFEERGLGREAAWSVVGWSLVGAFLGAKLYFVLLHGEPRALVSRGGFVWYGGLAGGLVAGVVRARGLDLPLGRAADAAAPALALGHGIGHLGCFFSGDSYGVPSDLPWAVAFPRGMPPSTAGNLRRIFGVDVPPWIPDERVLAVHPTMLYSAAALLAVAGLLWFLQRRPWPPGRLFAVYLGLAGLERFLVEFLRAKDDRFLWGFTTAQGVALVSLVAGLGLYLVLRSRPTPPEEPVAASSVAS